MRKGRAKWQRKKSLLAAGVFIIFLCLPAAGKANLLEFSPDLFRSAPDSFTSYPFSPSPAISSAQTDQSFSSSPRLQESFYLRAYPANRRLPSSNGFGDLLFESSLIASVGLQAADYLTTIKALKYPVLEEGSPLMKPLAKKPYAFAAVKLGISTLSYLITKHLYKKDKRVGWVISTLTNLSLSYVVANNLKMIKLAQNQGF